MLLHFLSTTTRRTTPMFAPHRFSAPSSSFSSLYRISRTPSIFTSETTRFNSFHTSTQQNKFISQKLPTMALQKRLGASSFNSSRLFGSFSLGGWNWNSSPGVVVSNGDDTATYYEPYRKNKCHYEVLGVSRLATPQTVKTAYHKMCFATHPDVSNDPAASNKFKQLQNSYEVLSDIGLRFQYDANKLVNNDSIEDTPFQPSRFDRLSAWALEQTSFSTNIAKDVSCGVNHAMFDQHTWQSFKKPAKLYFGLGTLYKIKFSTIMYIITTGDPIGPTVPTLLNILLECVPVAAVSGVGVVSLYASMIAAHEVGHILAFRAYGVPHSSVRFNYFGGFVAGHEFKTDWQSAVMYLGGPALGSVGAIGLILTGVALQTLEVGQTPGTIKSIGELLQFGGTLALSINLWNLLPVRIGDMMTDGSYVGSLVFRRLKDGTLPMIPISVFGISTLAAIFVDPVYGFYPDNFWHSENTIQSFLSISGCLAWSYCFFGDHFSKKTHSHKFKSKNGNLIAFSYSAVVVAVLVASMLAADRDKQLINGIKNDYLWLFYLGLAKGGDVNMICAWDALPKLHVNTICEGKSLLALAWSLGRNDIVDLLLQSPEIKVSMGDKKWSMNTALEMEFYQKLVKVGNVAGLERFVEQSMNAKKWNERSDLGLEIKECDLHDKPFLIYTYASGSKYVGEWKNDKRFGNGTYTHADGWKYVGEWKDGKKDGNGTWTDADDDKYVGEFKNGKKDGNGIYTWADGDKYVGEWKNGKLDGNGTHTRANGTIFHSGEWENGEPRKKH